MKKEKRILTALSLIRELDYIKGTIMAQLQDELREMVKTDKQKQTDEKQAELVF